MFDHARLRPSRRKRPLTPFCTMPCMKRALAIALAVYWFALAGAAYAADNGFTQLFNGHDKQGWEQAGPGNFTVEDGNLVTHGGMGLLWYTPKKFTNYILRVEYKMTHPNDNSGVFIKTGPNKPAGPQGAWYGVHHGYEVQIDDTDDEYHRTGCIYSLVHCDVNSKPAGEWNVMEIHVNGRTINVFMNGKQVTHYVEGQPAPPRKHDWEPERHLRPLSGYIGLQNHNDDSRVLFRKVEIKELR